MKNKKITFISLLIIANFWTGPLNAQEQAITRVRTTADELPTTINTPDIKSNFFNTEHLKERARKELPGLLKAVFNMKRQGSAVLLTVDPVWKEDSLVIYYNFFKGSNLLVLDTGQLVENIIYTFKPAEINMLDTEEDEFLFLYLRNSKKDTNIYSVYNRPQLKELEETWSSSLGIPVRAESLPLIIEYLKDLRQ
jgi:hypothetical protein